MNTGADNKRLTPEVYHRLQVLCYRYHLDHEKLCSSTEFMSGLARAVSRGRSIDGYFMSAILQAGTVFDHFYQVPFDKHQMRVIGAGDECVYVEDILTGNREQFSLQDLCNRNIRIIQSRRERENAAQMETESDYER